MRKSISGQMMRLALIAGSAWYVLALLRDRRERSGIDIPDRSGPLPATPFLDPKYGRLADAPSAFPSDGWRAILKRTYREAVDDRVPTLAAGITFFGLLAVFPALTVLVSLYGLIANPVTVRDHLFALSFMLPAGTFEIVEDQIRRVVAEGESALSVKLGLGLAVAMWGRMLE